VHHPLRPFAFAFLSTVLCLGSTAPAQEEIPLRGWDAPPYWRASAAAPRNRRRRAREPAGVDPRQPALAFVGLTPWPRRRHARRLVPAGNGLRQCRAGALRSFVPAGPLWHSPPRRRSSRSTSPSRTPLGGGFTPRVYRPAGRFPSVSTLNYLGGRRSPTARRPLGAGGAISVIPGSRLDLIVDVNGYYLPADGRQLRNRLSGSGPWRRGRGSRSTRPATPPHARLDGEPGRSPASRRGRDSPAADERPR